MSETPSENPKPEKDGDEVDIDLFRRLSETITPRPFRPTAEIEPEDDVLDEFWAVFSMITHTGERFALDVCFRNRRHYNEEMRKLELAKNIHVVLQDINDESVVIKRDILLHVLPSDRN